MIHQYIIDLYTKIILCDQTEQITLILIESDNIDIVKLYEALRIQTDDINIKCVDKCPYKHCFELFKLITDPSDKVILKVIEKINDAHNDDRDHFKINERYENKIILVYKSIKNPGEEIALKVIEMLCYECDEETIELLDKRKNKFI